MDKIEELERQLAALLYDRFILNQNIEDTKANIAAHKRQRERDKRES